MKKVIQTSNINEWHSTITRVGKAINYWCNNHNATNKIVTKQRVINGESVYKIVVEVEDNC